MATREEREAELTRLCNRVREIDHAPQCRCWDCKAFLIAYEANQRAERQEGAAKSRAECEANGEEYPFDDDGNLIETQYPVRMK